MNSKTREILDYFKDISSIPRCSGNEEKLAKWLQQWADEKGYTHQSDSAGNLKISVGASQAYEDAPGIVLQGHMDMVCEKSLDSESEGVFTVGCAGGQDVQIEKELAWTKIPDATELFKLNIQGLTGGHSGIDIHRGRANANKLLGRALRHIHAACPIRLISFNGGTAHNAIPRDASAMLACETAHIKTMQNLVSEFKQTLLAEYTVTEKNMSLSLLQLEMNHQQKTALSTADTEYVIH